MQAYLTRRRTGAEQSYILTGQPPVIELIHGTNEYDAYPRPGDPLFVPHICHFAAVHVFGIDDLRPLEVAPVDIRGKANAAKFWRVSTWSCPTDAEQQEIPAGALLSICCGAPVKEDHKKVICTKCGRIQQGCCE